MACNAVDLRDLSRAASDPNHSFLGLVMIRRHLTVMFDAPVSKPKHPDSAAPGKKNLRTSSSASVKSCQDVGQLGSADLSEMVAARLLWFMAFPSLL